MTIVVEEKYKGRRQDLQSAEVIYLVFGLGEDKGNVDDQTAFDAVAGAIDGVDGAPAEWNGLVGANIDVRNELIQGTVWEVAASYGTADPKVWPQDSLEYEFNFQAESEKIYSTLETRGIYTPWSDGESIQNLNFFEGQINVKFDKSESNVEGVELSPGTATNTWVYKPLHADVTTAYQQRVEAAMGAVNQFPLLGRPAETMRLVNCQGGATFQLGIQPKWNIRFGFQFAENRRNFRVGNIKVKYKGGHDLLWAFYKEALNSENGETPDADDPSQRKLIVKKPTHIVIERVYPSINMMTLGSQFHP